MSSKDLVETKFDPAAAVNAIRDKIRLAMLEVIPQSSERARDALRDTRRGGAGE